MIQIRLVALPLSLALSSLLLACNPSIQPPTPTATPNTMSSTTSQAPPNQALSNPSALLGDWQLVSGDLPNGDLPNKAQLSIILDNSLNLADGLDNNPNNNSPNDNSPNANLSNLLLSGAIGCNRLTVPVVANDTTLVAQGAPFSTLMACDDVDPKDELYFGDFLAKVGQYTLTGDTLTLSDGNNQATFQRAPSKQSTPSKSAKQLKQAWQLIDAVGFDTPLSADDIAKVVINFDDNIAYATAGCNSLTFGFDETTSQFSNPTSTRMACMDTPAEPLLIEFLPSVNRHNIKQQQLILTNTQGQRLIFTPKTP